MTDTIARSFAAFADHDHRSAVFLCSDRFDQIALPQPGFNLDFPPTFHDGCSILEDGTPMFMGEFCALRIKLGQLIKQREQAQERIHAEPLRYAHAYIKAGRLAEGLQLLRATRPSNL